MRSKIGKLFPFVDENLPNRPSIDSKLIPIIPDEEEQVDDDIGDYADDDLAEYL